MMVTSTGVSGFRSFAHVAGLAVAAALIAFATSHASARAAVEAQGGAAVIALLDDPSRPVMPQPPSEPEPPDPPAGAEAGDDGEDTATGGDAAAAEQGEPEQPPASPAARSAPSAPASPARSSRRQVVITDPPLPPQRPDAEAGTTQPDSPAQEPAAAELPDAGEPAGEEASTAALENDAAPEPALAGPDIDAPGLIAEDTDPLHEAEQAIREELEMGPKPSFPLHVSARLTEDGGFLPHGLIWRVFRAQPNTNGTFELVGKSREATPSFLLPADDYIVHVAYGLANSAKRVALTSGAVEQEVILDAGGLRINCVDALDQEIPDRQVSLSIYSSSEDEYGQRRLILEEANPRQIIRLNPGTYHVVSRYGDANAIIRADIQVRAGELTEARIQHRAATVTLKLVNELGGEALANTNWTILSPEGETIKESYGAFPTHVLMAGEYTVVARHDGRIFNRNFDIEPGGNREIELVAR
jgi:hypothetical protein